MQLVKGRPEDTADRLPKEIRVYDFLDSLGIEYERVDHAAAMTMEECAEIDRVLCATVCKNLFSESLCFTEFLRYEIFIFVNYNLRKLYLRLFL